jgi:hypothetical protein
LNGRNLTNGVRRLTFRLAVALLTFSVGVAVVGFWFVHRFDAVQIDAVQTLGLPPCASPPDYEMVSVPCAAPDLSVFSRLPVIEYCDLIREAASHANQVIRVRGIYVLGMEQSALYDPACRSEDSWTWVDVETYSNFQDAIGLANLRRGYSAEAIFLGKFSGRSDNGYGHLDCCPYKLSVMRVEEIKYLVSDAN